MNPYLDVLVNDLDVGAELVGASEAAAADGAAVRLLLVGRVDGGDVVVEPRLAGEGLAAVVAGEPDLVHVDLQCNASRGVYDELMTMSMLKQASSKSWLSSKLWALEFEFVIRRKGCEKFE